MIKTKIFLLHILIFFSVNTLCVFSDNEVDDHQLIMKYQRNAIAVPSSDSLLIGKEIISRPTDKTSTLHIVAKNDITIYIEYGIDSSKFNNKSQNFEIKKDSAFVFLFDNLLINTKYYYRLNIKEKKSSTFTPRNTYSFYTQKAKNSNFVFDIIADPHLDSNSIPEALSLSLKNIIQDNPDFIFDLGDNFMCEKLSDKSQKNITDRHLLLRSFYEEICHSVPLYLILGNHEGEWGNLTDNNAKNLSILTTNTRKFYFSNPEPNTFYTGNSKPESQVGLRQNYYAFEWGNALFVVLDPYWFTNPKTGWGMTLGNDQYNWFKSTLTASNSKYKFVFCHNLVGGANKDMRGGIEAADFYEWGGKDTNGTWTFNKNRPQWDKTIHQIMVETGVNVFFHGHDHFYGYQEKDGIIYQELPQPSNKNLTNLSAGSYGYLKGVLLPGRGYLRVTVADTATKLEYVKTILPSEEKGGLKNKEIPHQYFIKQRMSDVITENLINDISINASPNPANNSISIKGSALNCSNVSIEIYELETAKIIKMFNSINLINGSFEVKWDVDDLLPSGTYICRINSCNIFKSVKIVIN